VQESSGKEQINMKDNKMRTASLFISFPLKVVFYKLSSPEAAKRQSKYPAKTHL
jgi:hypothetical protein